MKIKQSERLGVSGFQSKALLTSDCGVINGIVSHSFSANVVDPTKEVRYVI